MSLFFIFLYCFSCFLISLLLVYLFELTSSFSTNAGTLRAIAVSSPQRSPIMPTVPTMAESGYPDVEAVAWHGIFVPTGTPQAIVDRLNLEIVRALADPEIRSVLAKQAMSPVGNSQAEFRAFLEKDLATWKAVATMAKVSVE